MKIQVISDCHLEFHKDDGTSFLASIVQEANVLIIAGDLGLQRHLYPSFKFLSPLYPHIIYVTGNHEYYHSNPESVHKELKHCQKEFKNLHWLNNSMVAINGQRFLGGTGWFPDQPDNFPHKCRLSDFSCIQGFEPWVYERHNKFRRFLQNTLKKKDIVVMHHLPSSQSTPDFFRHSELNRFFWCDITDELIMASPSIAIHGHTHSTCDYKINLGNKKFGTRIVCNPFGYVDLGLNRQFKDDLILEV